MSDVLTRELVGRWRDNPRGAYQSWFLWDDRLKNFRSIRRGVQQVAAEIQAGRFGVAYRDSSPGLFNANDFVIEFGPGSSKKGIPSANLV